MKKKRNGFTLVELLAVVVILATIAIIVTPTVLDQLESSKQKTYVEQTHILEETAERWSVKNANKLEENSKYYLDINTLVKEGYLDNADVIDPRDDKKMNGCIVITFDKESNQFDFNYNENTCATLKG